MGIVPIREGLYGWWITETQPAGGQHTQAEAQAHLLRNFGDWHAPIRQLIETSPQIIRNDLYDRPPLAKWHWGRAVLLGDAAHPTTPNLGQGGCMAIEDGIVLARCIAHYGPSEKALERYQTLRQARTTKVTEISRQVGSIGQWRNPIAVAARTALYRLTPASVSIRMLDQFFCYDPWKVAL